jgi:hypothetical protein
LPLIAADEPSDAGRRAESFDASPPPSPPAPPPPSALRLAALEWFDEFQWQTMVNHGDLGLISGRRPAVNGGGGTATATSSSSAVARTRVAPYPFSPSPPPSPPVASTTEASSSAASSANPAQSGASKVKSSMSTEKLPSSFVSSYRGDPNLASPHDLFSRAVAFAMPTSSSRGALPQLPAPPTQLMLDAKGRCKEGAVSGSGGFLTSSPKREADLAENSTSLAENSTSLAENSTSLAENSLTKMGKLMSFGKNLLIPSSSPTEISRWPSSAHFSESEIVPAAAALQKFIEKHGLYPMMATDGRGWPRAAADEPPRLPLMTH